MSSDLGGMAGAEIRSRADLVRRLHEGLAAQAGGAAPRIGVEAEYLPIDPATGAARPYAGAAGVEAALATLEDRGYENPPPRAPHTVRLVKGALSINLEPGAQIEISGTPLPSLGEVATELRAATAHLGRAARAHGFRFCGLGAQPVSSAGEIEIVPKRRYEFMTGHLAARGGPRFRDMMRRTASVQASFDFEDEADAGRKFRLGLLAGPVAAAVFAHSAVALGRPSGLLCERLLVWIETDPARCGWVPGLLDGEWSFDRYVDWAAGVPAIVVRAEDGGVEEAGGRPFSDLLARGGPGGRALTMADWDIHLTTIFTDARLKRGVVECRTCDALRPAENMAIPALWTGLLYHRPSIEAALELLRPHAAALDGARGEIARAGLRATLPGGPALLDLARQLVRLAAVGLDARGLGERRFLAPAEEWVEAGRMPADRALAIFERGGVTALVEDTAA